MQFVHLTPIQVFFVVMCFQKALVNSLQCFECTISDGEECIKPTQSSKVRLTNCSESIFTLGASSNQYSCLTTVEKNSTTTIYTRRCALPTETVLCNQESNSNLNLVECKFCNSDYCNSSSLKLSNIYSVGFILLLIYYLTS